MGIHTRQIVSLLAVFIGSATLLLPSSSLALVFPVSQFISTHVDEYMYRDLKNRFEKNVGLWRRFSKASFRLVPRPSP